jgi:hypothetical protein
VFENLKLFVALNSGPCACVFAAGCNPKARATCQEFLTLWKHAESGCSHRDSSQSRAHEVAIILSLFISGKRGGHCAQHCCPLVGTAIPLGSRKICHKVYTALRRSSQKSPRSRPLILFILKNQGLTNSILVDSRSDEAKKHVSMQNMYNTCNSLEALIGDRTFI